MIPLELRKKYNMFPGKEIRIIEYEGILYFVPPIDNAIEAACGFLPNKPSLSEELINERNDEYKQ